MAALEIARRSRTGFIKCCRNERSARRASAPFAARERLRRRPGRGKLMADGAKRRGTKEKLTPGSETSLSVSRAGRATSVGRGAFARQSESITLVNTWRPPTTIMLIRFLFYSSSWPPSPREYTGSTRTYQTERIEIAFCCQTCFRGKCN